MQTPVEIDFQGMSGTPEVHASIEKHVAELEQRYGRVTTCRVVLKGPGGHHRTGGLYEVNIRLALPNGREVNVGRTAQADERQAGLSFAINDAFKHVRRRLQDRVRRLQGQVKQHESQPMGTVKSLDASGEFGFLEAADGHEVYFHRNSVLDGAYNRLAVGTHVAFAEEMGEEGPQASTVKLLGKHGYEYEPFRCAARDFLAAGACLPTSRRSSARSTWSLEGSIADGWPAVASLSWEPST